MDKFGNFSASGGTTRPIIAYLIEYLMNITSMVVMTPNCHGSNFMGQRSNFQHGPMKMNFDIDDP